jgi:hypothetical protein
MPTNTAGDNTRSLKMNAKPYQSTPMPTSTPWGAPDFCEQIAPGWWRVETPSHGGFLLSPERLADIPQQHLDATFGMNGQHGVFEEDCDWCVPVLAFQDEYRAYCEREGDTAEHIDRVIQAAHDTLNNWLMKDWMERIEAFPTDESRSYGPHYKGAHA